MAVAIGGVIYATRSGEHAHAPVDASVVVSIDAGLPKPPAIAAAKPQAAFAGSKQCADCHDKEYAGWQTSWHARALAPATGRNLAGDFPAAHYTGSSSEAWMKRAAGTPAMRTRGPDGEFADFRVDYVIGGKRMQDDVTVFPDGRWQVLPVYFHVTDHTWVDYTEAKQGALSPEHPFYWTNSRRMANHECLDCHTTALHVAYDDATHAWKTEFVDGSVACEDCHGPGAKHSETSEKADIVHPESGNAGMTMCARCHGPRRPLWPLLDADHAFQPGDDYDDYYEPIVMTLGNGDSTDFFVDGKPKTSSFEYQAMLQSACFRKGKADCLTCHTAPHDKGHRKAELRAEPAQLCAKCHAGLAGPAHSHHKSASCVACHMAPIVSGVLDAFADHSIDVPVPANTQKHAVPNACGVCHPTKSPAELDKAITDWWPDAPKRQARRLRLADAFDPAGGVATAKPLLGVIADAGEAPTLRGAAAVLVGRRFGPQSAQVLEKLLDHDSVILRAKGCEALAAAKATSSGDALVARLSDRALRVRLAAALALHDLHDPRGDLALQQLADDPATQHLMIPHLELGQAAGARRDWATAKRELTWVAKLAPYYADPIVQLAAVERELGDLVAARARVDQALQLEPRHRGALGLRAKLTP